MRVLAPRGCPRFTGESNKKASKHSRDEALGRVCVCRRRRTTEKSLKFTARVKSCDGAVRCVLWAGLANNSLSRCARARQHRLSFFFSPSAPAPTPALRARHIKHQMRQMEDNVASVGNIYDIQGFSS